MGKFCQNCGKELNEGQDVCISCGSFVNKTVQAETPVASTPAKKDHGVYFVTTGIIMIVLGFCLLAAYSQDTSNDAFLTTFGLPGLAGLIGGIVSIPGKKNGVSACIAGGLYALGVVINTIAIASISIFGIVGTIFAILNFAYGSKMLSQ